MKYIVTVLGKKYEVEVKELSPTTYEVSVNGQKAVIEISRALPVAAKVEKKEEIKVEKKVEEKKEVPKAEGKVITAPMAGVVTKILKKPGDEVQEGETVLILEAMKMENPINSPYSGVISEIVVKEGDKVGNGDPLVYIR